MSISLLLPAIQQPKIMKQYFTYPRDCTYHNIA